MNFLSPTRGSFWGFLGTFVWIHLGLMAQEAAPIAEDSDETPAAASSATLAMNPTPPRGTQEARDLFLELATKAADGDVAVAEELSNLAETSGPVRLPASLETEGIPESAAVARELLSELLLSSPNPAIWPTGHSWLDRSIQDGSVVSLERQAAILLNGSRGREKSIPQAIKLLQRAREMPGATQAHFLLGNLASRGIGMPQDGDLALTHFREGAEAGSIPCLIGLHQLHRDGRIVEKDLEEAAQFGKEAADLGSAEAAFQMGVFYESFVGEEPDWAQAAQWLQLASDRGQASATTRLGGYYMYGRLGKSDPERAIELCRLAVEQGDAEACFLMAGFYLEGTQVPKDLVASTAWLKMAAGRGHVPSQNELGVRLSQGLGVSRDLETAVRWFVQAAEKGFPPAMVNLGEILENGVGVEKNVPEARKLYDRAAKANHAGAQIRLARMLAAGTSTGIPDPVGAAYWAEVSARKEESSRPIAEQLKETLSEAQQGELQRRLEAIDS
ncbi:MAG: tetratricopeptide repeat protein [Verrucomicrobiota bacterium]